MNHAAIEDTGAAQELPRGHEATRRAGRGVLSMTGSKLYFLVAGYAAQLLLPRLLASPEAFGFFSSAMSLVSIVNNVLITATIQVVSKRVSEDPERAEQTLRQAIVLQLVVGVSLGGALLLGAPWLAGRVMFDPLLTPLFRLSAVVVVCYSLYAALIGALNGRQNFLGQARFDMGYTTLRTTAMLGTAALGWGAVGVFGGFASASALVLLAALFVVGVGRGGLRTGYGGWLSLMAPLWLYQLCLNLMLQVDVSLLKRTVAQLLQDSGAAAAVAAETASRYVGFYRAAQTFAFVPYQLILSVAFVIFPMVSEALSLGDEGAARSYIRAALRFSLLVLLAVAAPFAGAAPAVMRFVYPAAYVAGAPALSILALAMVCFALFVIAATIMSGAGRPAIAATVALSAVGVVVAGNIGLVRAVGVGEHTLIAAASGTGLGTLLALIAMGIAVRVRFGVFVAPTTAARALIAAAVAAAVSHAVMSPGKLMTLVALGLGAISYAVVLVVLRELTVHDLVAVQRVVRRKS